MDWGLAALAQIAEENENIFSPTIDSASLILEIQDPQEASILLTDYLKQQLNSAVLLPMEAKLLGYSRSEKEDGFYDAKQSWQLSKQEQEQIQETYQARIKARLKAQGKQDAKIPRLTIQKKPQVSIKRNYPGLRLDWDKLGKNLEAEVNA